MGQKTVIAIPVRNEQQHLNACLAALSVQTRRADAIVLLLNNCTDGSLDICRQASRSWPGLHVMECKLDANDASAGEARRRAFDHALALADDGVILTTDADSLVPPTWVADNLAEIALGADCVCGMAMIDQADGVVARPRLAFDDMRETLLLSLQDEIVTIVDPEPFDPWPRHQQRSGASIAVRAATLRQAGGAPRVAAGEDRALIANLALVNARIRHAPHIQVIVSGRLDGRAVGGMAQTIARRLHRQDLLTDAMIEPTVDAYRRVLSRLRLRRIALGETEAEGLATDLLIPPQTLLSATQARYFGQAWADIQRESQMLQRRRVAFYDLARETRQALALRDHLRTSGVHHRDNSIWADLRHAM